MNAHQGEGVNEMHLFITAGLGDEFNLQIHTKGSLCPSPLMLVTCSIDWFRN